MSKIIELLTDDGIKLGFQHQNSVLSIPDDTPERVLNKALKYPKIGEILFSREGNLTTH